MDAKPDVIGRQGSEASRRFDDIHGSTAKEKIQNAYARLRGTSHIETPSMTTDSITPSSAGDIEAVAAVPVPHATLPLSTRTHETSADPTGLPEHHGDAGDLVVVAPSLLFSGQEEVQTISPAAVFEQTEDILPGSLRLGPSEFAVAMSIDSVSKDSYERMLSEHLESIKLFLAGFKAADGSLLSEDDQAKLTTDIRLLIKKLDNITVHTDLNIAEHVKQFDLDITKEATWAEYNSAKFLFLGQLIEIAGAQELHFLFIVGQKETAELLERYFLGKGFGFVRPRAEMRGNIELSFINGSLSVGILLAQHDGTVETYRPPTLIFAIDSSFNASSPMVEHLRTTYARNGNLLPVVHLIVTNSSEHIQRCLSDLPEQQKLRVLVHIVRSLVDILGDLQDEASHVQDNVEEIFTCLMSDDFNANWKLPSIEPLHILVSDEISSGEETETRGIMDPPSTISKRVYDNLDSDTPDSKRQRLQLSQNLTLMTTQSSAASQSNIDLSAKLQALEARLVEMKADHAAEVERMQKTISDQETGLQQRVAGWEDLQHRYEARYKELHQIRKERDTLLADKAKADEKAVRDKEEIVKLKDERTQLRHELESARNELKGEGGSKEEMETLREKIRELNESNAKLQRANESEKQQSEYLRRKFQEDYSRVAELNGEKDQLQARIDILQSQVDAEAVKLKQLKTKDDEYKHAERVKELEQRLETCEALLRRKDEELRNIRNNRPATRATSTQPRSPKSWGNGSRPTSPGLNNNNNNNGVGNRGSGLRFSSEIPF